MRKLSLFAIACLVLAASLAAQPKGQAATGSAKKVLLAYEVADKNLDPWRTLLREELTARGYATEEAAAASLAGRDLSGYDLVLLYGAVMAFASKEPLRDWLGAGAPLRDRPAALFVTANRWFLAKYFEQLKSLLGKGGARLTDAVSAATKGLGEDEKKALVRGFVGRLKP